MQEIGDKKFSRKLFFNMPDAGAGIVLFVRESH